MSQWDSPVLAHRGEHGPALPPPTPLIKNSRPFSFLHQLLESERAALFPSVSRAPSPPGDQGVSRPQGTPAVSGHRDVMGPSPQ